jgi:hypothetical protein
MDGQKTYICLHLHLYVFKIQIQTYEQLSEERYTRSIKYWEYISISNKKQDEAARNGSLLSLYNMS